jgi:hypothetical protein
MSGLMLISNAKLSNQINPIVHPERAKKNDAEASFFSHLLKTSHAIFLGVIDDQSWFSFSQTLRERCGDTLTIQPALRKQVLCIAEINELIRQSQVPQRLDKTPILNSGPGRHSDKRSSAFAGALSERLSHWVSLKNSTRSHDSMSIACVICSLYWPAC